MDSLDEDAVDYTGMSTMDMNARLTQRQITAHLSISGLKRIGVLPDEMDLSRLAKRLSVSLNGLGRIEKKEMVIGERDMQSGGRLRNFVSGLFTPKG